jgi:hypothetical protein
VSTFKPNPAQVECLQRFKTGQSLRITAAAGSGKTSTLEYLAANSLDRKILYIAFNKTVQVEAEARFPRNVTAKTAHSLAHAQFGRALQHRLGNQGRVSPQQASRILGQSGPFVVAPEARDEKDGGITHQAIVLSPAAMASLALATMRRYMRSAAERVEPRHFSAPEGTEHAPGLPALRTRIVELAQLAWEDVSSPDGVLRCEHDVYLKLWAMSRPRLSKWDVLMIDEAQDTDPLLAHVIAEQPHAQIVVVGDEAQSIYGWRGATDFITKFPAQHTVELAQSFRFGPAVADEANVWLDHVGTRMRVLGSPAKRSTVVTGQLSDPDAILCRSNAGALAAVMKCIAERRPVALVGGAAELERFVKAAEVLQQGRATTHPDLLAFNSWPEVQDYVETEEGADLAVWVKLVDKHGTVALLNAIASTVDEPRADVVVSTAHKAKGRQWPRVQIWSDFREPKIDKQTGLREKIIREEAMLAYVAVTRAEDVLDNTGLAWVHDPDYALNPVARTPAGYLTPCRPKAASLHRVLVSPSSQDLSPAPFPQAPGLSMSSLGQ